MVEKNSPGIYTVKGDVFAIQIIDVRHLSDNENLWLKNLRGKLGPKAINKVIAELEKQDKTVSLGAYMDVVNRANSGSFKEVLEMRAPTFKQMLMDTEIGAGWIKEWESKAQAKGEAEGKAKGLAEGKAEGKAEGLAQVARNLKLSGMSNKLISQYTGLSLAKINKVVKIK